LALAAWVLVLGFAWRLRRRLPGFALGVGIFLVGHALESSVFPLLLYFEHRNYLPAIGAIWALLSLASFAVEQLHQRMDQPARIFTAGGVALILVLALATTARAGVWQTQRSLLAQGLQYHPDSRWLRMALIRQAMEMQPQDIAEARQHAQHLMASSDPSTRRLGAVLKLIMECDFEGSAPPEVVAAAFQGKPDPVEPDLLVAFESLSEGVMQRPCRDFSTAQMGAQLAGMLDRTALPPSDRSIWRLRLKAAKLYAAAGEGDEALRQARLAYNDLTDAPVPMFIAALLLQRGDTIGAAVMVDEAERKMRSDDVNGQQLLQRYRAEIAR
jgi:hypothetical protein